MTKSKLPINVCSAKCPKCIMSAQIKLFEGEFNTYIGAKTGNYYRFDLIKIKYLGHTLSELLSEAKKEEGELLNPTVNLQCSLCGSIYNADSIIIEFSEIIDAYEL